jgi:hypothetical protein
MAALSFLQRTRHYTAMHNWTAGLLGCMQALPRPAAIGKE